MEKKSAIKLAKDLFKHYPDTNEFFFTEDEQPFFNESDAINHARGFNADEPLVVSVKRDELGEKDSANESSSDKTGKASTDNTNAGDTKSAELIAAEKAVQKAEAAVKSKKSAQDKAKGAAKEKALVALTDAEKLLAEASAKLIEVLNTEKQA